MSAAADKAEALVKRIIDQAKEFVDQGVKSDAYAMAASGILAAQLIKALDRIEGLEGDIKLLTDLLASVEEKR
ncbi:hypothetical protein D3C76_1737870 [compost metagenome]|uniref:Uncharacterized protein n=1 Tax=Pseudomonas jinjuensis TaxID=198616 RepID=A0A1H0JT91_9PSED|nr:hypothetical protein [Pseudomonas jinjuensis]SDO46641.1 hypothetical protein SAMN05216193_111188 [Pseudomonas jinjuensis]